MVVYTKGIQGDGYWHFCTECSNYPSGSVSNRVSIPYSEDICKECKKLEKMNKCAKKY